MSMFTLHAFFPSRLFSDFVGLMADGFTPAASGDMNAAKKESCCRFVRSAEMGSVFLTLDL